MHDSYAFFFFFMIPLVSSNTTEKLERMTVVEYLPPTPGMESYSFDGARHQEVVRPMPSGAQATTPTAKWTSVQPSHGRGLVILERNNPCHSHHQMMLCLSDSITAEIPSIKESSVEMSREKGLSCKSERKHSKATESSPTYATETEQAYKSSRRADPYRE